MQHLIEDLLGEKSLAEESGHAPNRWPVREVDEIPLPLLFLSFLPHIGHIVPLLLSWISCVLFAQDSSSL